MYNFNNHRFDLDLQKEEIKNLKLLTKEYQNRNTEGT